MSTFESLQSWRHWYESTFDSLLVSTLVQQFGGIPTQRVALAATRQVIHHSIPQQPEIIGVIGNSAEPGKKSRDRVDWLATTPADRMRELVRLAQATPQKSDTFSTGVRLLLERGMRCGSAFSNTETNPLAKIRREVWLSVFPSDPALTTSASKPKPQLTHRASA
jgi:hypothetical protein